jgi:uncharacterized glyoxalase superfamily protein PhnB
VSPSRVIPMPTYEDVGAAAEWLVHSFGFGERGRWADESGRVTTAELEVAPGGDTILLGWTGPEYESPRRHAESCEASRRWQETTYIVDGVLVYVDDVDAHFARARDAGSGILSAPSDGPFGRLYRTEDVEGHRWMFMQG